MEGAAQLETKLGDQDFLGGGAPCSYDCCVYATLLPLYRLAQAGVALPDPGLRYIVASDRLRQYVRRMSAVAFPDLGDLLLEPTAAGDAQTFRLEARRA
ncbi:hypothetical protein STCU_11756 [Strigomonas culicis]|uniref:Metaxin glutathione S-transferase domain-containing protein n=1 Tax=Strigomonas culicis TaxID=28005 RepID=S9THI9_9TRYP|nr:hypothetical protein STCU_11756 [Strigomonas culicis]|eukprot:EPY15798.1 hypothetical protein STCU_11756 [Strigomonas culicis]